MGGMTDTPPAPTPAPTPPPPPQMPNPPPIPITPASQNWNPNNYFLGTGGSPFGGNNQGGQPNELAMIASQILSRAGG